LAFFFAGMRALYVSRFAICRGFAGTPLSVAAWSVVYVSELLRWASDFGWLHIRLHRKQ